jgi:transposase
MRIIEMVRLWEQGFSQRDIATSVNCARSPVGEIQRRCREQGLVTYAQVADMTDEDILSTLYPEGFGGRPAKHEPDWETIQQKLNRQKRTNLRFIWEEYRVNEPSGLGYSQFCNRYAQWQHTTGKQVVMVQEKEPGKELFVDWMGDTLECVLDSETGKLIRAHFFVATLGDSGYPVVEAFPDERMDSWLTAHVHTFGKLGGLPRIVVPDNCRTAVTKSCYYDPTINRAYNDLAKHYKLAVIPARIRAPRDKASVEGSVGWLETWLVQWLKEQPVFSGFTELNYTIQKRMSELVKRPFQKRKGSRESVFLELDKPALRPLPTEPYEYAVYQTRKVPDNYHLEFAGFYYSVPHEYYKREVTFKASAAMIEVYDGCRKRIAIHERHYTGKRYVTLRNHMPDHHQFRQDQNRFDGKRYRSWARSIGENTFFVVDHLLTAADIEETSYRSCMGILQYAKTCGNERLEGACKRARELQSCSYTTVYHILKNRQETAPLFEVVNPTPVHDNLRDASSFV